MLLVCHFSPSLLLRYSLASSIPIGNQLLPENSQCNCYLNHSAGGICNLAPFSLLTERKSLDFLLSNHNIFTFLSRKKLLLQSAVLLGMWMTFHMCYSHGQGLLRPPQEVMRRQQGDRWTAKELQRRCHINIFFPFA